MSDKAENQKSEQKTSALNAQAHVLSPEPIGEGALVRMRLKVAVRVPVLGHAVVNFDGIWCRGGYLRIVIPSLEKQRPDIEAVYYKDGDVFTVMRPGVVKPGTPNVPKA